MELAKSTPLSEARNSLQNATERIDTAITLLTSKLEPVLSPSRPEGTDNAPTAAPVRSPFVDSLHSSANRLHLLASFIEDLSGRVEV